MGEDVPWIDLEESRAWGEGRSGPLGMCPGMPVT